jgi:glutaredoxin-related protein
MQDSIESKITSFFALVEKQVQNLEYGTLSVNVLLSNGLPNIQTINIVKQKRIRYKVDNYSKEK